MNRLHDRENCFFRKQYKQEESRTKKTLDEERKKEMLEYNVKTFGKVAIGVHGKELPKYRAEDSTKEWWKMT